MKKILIIIAAVIALSCSQKERKMEDSGPLPPPVPSAIPAEPMPSGAAPVEPESESVFFEKKEYSAADVSSAGTARPAPAAITPAQSGLKASFADDNEQFKSYIEFLDKYKNIEQIDFPVRERIIVRVADKDGKTVPDAVIVSGGLSSKTYANGETLFFPAERGQSDKYSVTVKYGETAVNAEIEENGKRIQEFRLPITRTVPASVNMDILFVLDTTGSMGEEIERLKQTLLIIRDNLAAMPSQPNLRFGMVMYRDRGDSYVTKEIPFTGNAEAFQAAISSVRAGGGGDTPEDLQSALDTAVNKMDWTDSGIRLTYVITDAATHLDYGQTDTLLKSAQTAAARGIKIHSIGTGGLDIAGEISLRQIAQYTMGKYIFLTYGERGDSEGGAPGSVSHHVGANYVSDRLETVIIRLSKEELSNYTLTPLETGEDYFTAVKGSEDSAKVLDELFTMAVTQLVSYSAFAFDNKTTAAVLPLAANDNITKASAEYFTEQLYLAAAKYKGWKPVERKDIELLLKEVNFNLSGLVDENSAVTIGEMAGAELLITGTVYKKDGEYEVYLRMIRTESGEVLSVTRCKIEEALGL